MSPVARKLPHTLLAASMLSKLVHMFRSPDDNSRLNRYFGHNNEGYSIIFVFKREIAT